MGAFTSIPSFTPQGVLPPYVGLPTHSSGYSPYRVALLEFVQHFATSDNRAEILKGFMSHRARLLTNGIKGFQWLDGSFVEDIENSESRPPGDVDVVTFHGRPPALVDPTAWSAFVTANMDVFNSAQSKVAYKVDAQYVDFTFGPVDVVRKTSFWCGLFSHKRVVGLWKGIVQVPLDGVDDAAANHFLATR